MNPADVTTRPKGIAEGGENIGRAADWQDLCDTVAEALPTQLRLVTPLDDLRATIGAAFPARLVLLNWWGFDSQEGQHL